LKIEINELKGKLKLTDLLLFSIW